jgi:5'-3' exonuclease
MWVTKYYFDECPSWEWYYPYDHAPLLKDIAKYISMIPVKTIKFKKGNPLRPFEQLLAVLPPQSSDLLPNSINKVMTDPSYGLNHLYPISFTLDYLGKRKFWQTTPFLPNLEIDSIKRVFDGLANTLDEKEQKRNSTKSIYFFKK